MHMEMLNGKGDVHCVPKKVSPLNILQQPPETCTDLNEILHTQDDIYFCHRRQFHKNTLFRLRDVQFFQTAVTNFNYQYYFFTTTAARSVTSTDWLKSGIVLIRTLLTEQWISGVIDCITVYDRKGDTSNIWFEHFDCSDSHQLRWKLMTCG